MATAEELKTGKALADIIQIREKAETRASDYRIWQDAVKKLVGGVPTLEIDPYYSIRRGLEPETISIYRIGYWYRISLR